MIHPLQPKDKDAPLEASLKKMQHLIHLNGFTLEETSELNSAGKIWSVHVRDKNCPFLYTNGKGTSRVAALVSAYGEFFERLSTNQIFTDYYLTDKTIQDFVFFPSEIWFSSMNDPDDEADAKKSLLSPELLAFYNPEHLLTDEDLRDFNSGGRHKGIAALPFTQLKDGKTVYFPVNILNTLYVSNGMASGNTQAEAQVQAMSEIIERYVKFKIIRERICLPDIPREKLLQYPDVQAALDKLKTHGFSFLIKDASLGGKYPVINITLINPENQGVFASFGAHPLFEVALERALTELLQGRSLSDMDGFPRPVFNTDEVENPANLEAHFIDSSGVIHWDFFGTCPLYDFNDWNFEGTRQMELHYLRGLLEKNNKKIFLAKHNHFGMHVCHIIVPGISEIYPVSDLWYENRSTAVPIREQLLKMETLDEKNIKKLHEMIMDIGFPREQSLKDILGIEDEKTTDWSNLLAGEIYGLLALAAGDGENAAMWLEWCSETNLLKPGRRSFYYCLYSMSQLTPKQGDTVEKHQKEIISRFFSTQTIQACLSILNDPAKYISGLLPDHNCTNFSDHQEIMRAYDKCQTAKKRIW